MKDIQFWSGVLIAGAIIVFLTIVTTLVVIS